VSTENAFRSLQTLMIHSTGFPHPTMRNRPEFFGIDATEENIKKFMSLGTCKLFPEQVQIEVFGSKAESPIHAWELIRSRFQSFVSDYTFAFMESKVRSLPATKLPACTKLEETLRNQGNEAMEKYLEHYDELCEESVAFWRSKSDVYKISPDQMEQAVRASFPSRSKLRDSFRFDVRYFDMVAPEFLGQANSIDALEKAEVIEACNKVAQEAGHKLQEEVDGFIMEVATDLENKTRSALKSLQESIASGKWNQKSINSVLKFAEGFKEINFINHTDLQTFMDEFKQQLEGYTAQDVKNDEGLATSLDNFLGESMNFLENLAEADKSAIRDSFGNMGKARKVRPF